MSFIQHQGLMPIKKFNPNLTNTASGYTLIISTSSHYTARGLVKKTKVSKQNLWPSVSPSKSPSKPAYRFYWSITQRGMSKGLEWCLCQPKHWSHGHSITHPGFSTTTTSPSATQHLSHIFLKPPVFQAFFSPPYWGFISLAYLVLHIDCFPTS